MFRIGDVVVRTILDAAWKEQCSKYNQCPEGHYSVIGIYGSGCITLAGFPEDMGFGPDYFTDVPKPIPQEEPPVMPEVDMVEKPNHYQFWPGVEVKDIMEAISESGLCDHMAPVESHYFFTKLKYHLRAGSKFNTLEDLAKADKYRRMAEEYKQRKGTK